VKTLKKIKIINWHYIWNETINIEPIVFLTGHTGAGKSTIIDALQVILLGDTKGFNKAALEKSARTLKGYLRGELGDTADGFAYLRNGRFSSYIAAEFYDDFKDESFTVGAVFDIFEDGDEEHRFFCLNAAIPPNEFINEKNIPYSYKDLVVYFKETYPDQYEFLPTGKQYQTFLQNRFGGLKNKYFNLFKKAVSFVPITDITRFITEFVCDTQINIDINKMQENITQYKRLEKEALNMQARILMLEDIEKAYKAFAATITNERLYGYVIERATYENELSQENILLERKTRSESRLKDIENILNTNKLSLRELKEKTTRLIEQRANSGDYSVTADLRKQRDEAQKKLLDIQNGVETIKANFEHYLTSYLGVAHRIVNALDGVELDMLEGSESEDLRVLLLTSKETIKQCEILDRAFKDKPEDLSDYSLKVWREALADFKKAVSAVNISIGKGKLNLDKKISALRMQETSLQSGQKSHDSAISLLRKTLQDQLSSDFNRSISIDFFADLIDVRDEKWVNATEGYLNTQRFSLFVDPKYYIKAYETLREIQKRSQFYGAILVDQEKVIDAQFKPSPGSLADEIVTDHAGAKAYANFLLGRLMKCNSPREAQSSGNGITPLGDLYRNYSLTTINPRTYEIRYIGRKINARDILAKQKEIQDLSVVLEKYRTIHDIVIDASNLELIGSYEVQNSLTSLSRIGEIGGLKETAQYFDKQLDSGSSDLEKTYDHQFDLLEADIRHIEDESNALHTEKGQLEIFIQNIIDEKIPESRRKLKELNTRLAEFDPFFIEETANPFFLGLVDSGKSYNEIIAEYRTHFSTIQYRSNSTFTEVVRLRKQYTQDYRLAYDVSERNNKVFDAELTDFRDVRLPEYQAKIHDAYEKAVIEFKDDFLDKIRSSIDQVEDQIHDLNIAIQEPTFGNDKYHFSVRPSSAYRRYYDMIKDDILLQKGGNEEFTTKYKDDIEDLFKQITSSGISNEAVVLQNIELFTNYMTYLDFDLIVTDKEGNEQRLSKMIKKKSGGETQTPFYIAVLASFVQLYRVKPNQPDDDTNNTTRLIVFDEAFSKMDSNRIKESIRLVRSLGLQVIISAPDDKIADISGLVDETLVVIRNGKKTYVKQFKEDIN